MDQSITILITPIEFATISAALNVAHDHYVALTQQLPDGDELQAIYNHEARACKLTALILNRQRYAQANTAIWAAQQGEKL